MTQIYDHTRIHEAANQLRAGGIVAFATETVYGLGAIANNQAAVERVFQVKGRPQDNPLIVHVDSAQTVQQFVTISPVVQKLMDHFWPGPLTIIFPYDGDAFAPNISAGQKTISFRMPKNQETLNLIAAVGFPLVGPSANKSGKPSPTRLEHVLHDFEGEIEGIMSSSPDDFEIGIESTVIYPSDEEIIILRPGAITQQMLTEVSGLPVFEKSAVDQLSETAIYSPGVKYTHYSPKQPVYLASYGMSLSEVASWIQEQDQSIGLLADDAWLATFQEDVAACYSLGPAGDIAAATRRMYAGLRYLEQTNVEVILAQGFDVSQENSHALMNRLTKASSVVL